MCNGIFGINNSTKIENIQSNPTNPVIAVKFKSPDDVEMVLKDIDEELCKEKECYLATEVFMGSNSRENLIEP